MQRIHNTCVPARTGAQKVLEKDKDVLLTRMLSNKSQMQKN